MYKISSIPGMYSRKLITADQAAALVKKNFRIHYGTGLGVPNRGIFFSEQSPSLGVKMMIRGSALAPSQRQESIIQGMSPNQSQAD